MDEPDQFREFVRRLRGGDELAAAELVRRYEPLVRREVRLRLEDRSLARLFDSADVCQSVLASFLLRAAAGQYDLGRPEQLLKLLVTMARNKLASATRRQYRHRRGGGRRAGGPDALEGVAADEPTPSRMLAGRELLERLRAELSDEERRAADLRAQGCSWAEVAARMGGTPQARRMQLARAVGRVAAELGLDDYA
jgi:RNA polymerase sigma-70 factor (ECF subfamily)